MDLNYWEITWLALGLAGAGIETAALINRRKKDTLSELVWRALGVFPPKVCEVCGLEFKEHAANMLKDGVTLHVFIPFEPPQSKRLPPAAVRIRRTAFVAFFAWLLLHFTTGWV